jgi:acyl-CoA oxidase
MLTRWARLTNTAVNGKPQIHFEEAENPVLAYGTLIPERVVMGSPGAVRMVIHALTVAVRYGVARRIGDSNRQIMDFQTHLTALVPGIAYAYVVNAVGVAIGKHWDEINRDQKVLLKSLPDMHAVSAAFKATCSYEMMDFLEASRRACGGHAVLAYNAIGGMISTAFVSTTGGGDNFALLAQTGVFDSF